MEKMDYKKSVELGYQASPKRVEALCIPPMNFLMIDGAGDPNREPAYALAVSALFSLSYRIKFAIKKGEMGLDYAVMPLEGLWWAEDMSQFNTADKSNWLWTLMIMQPPCVSAEIVDAQRAELARQTPSAALPQVRFAEFAEGWCAQTLHVGPFTTEGPTIQRVHQFIEKDHPLSGKHHEIYLSDIRKADPAKWRTIIRQPFA
jgi:hypothetical protein